MVSVVAKPWPSRAQCFDRLLHALRIGRLEPAAEGQHALRHAADHQQRGVADDLRPVAGRGPCDQHLRLRQQQRLEPVDFGAQRHRVVARSRCARAAWRRVRSSTSVASAAKQTRADDQREAPMSWRRGAAMRLAMRAPSAARPAHKSDAEDARTQGGEESAPPRTRTQPPVRRPDRLRHSGLPQACGRCPPRAARESGDFTPAGTSRRKSPDRERGLKWRWKDVILLSARVPDPRR